MLTQKQENFTQNLFKGMSQREAYIQAGYSSNQLPTTLDRHAFDLARDGKIVARLDELNQAVEDDSLASVHERKQIFSKILRTTPADLMEFSEDGRDLKIKPEALSSPAVSYIRTEQVMMGKMPVRITRLGLVDKMKSGSELNKMDHIYEAGSVIRDINVVFIIGKGYQDIPKGLKDAQG